MTNITYAIVFEGETQAGFEIDQVKKNFAKVFKTDSARVESLFSGKAVALKKGIDKTTALKYQQVLQKAGAKTRVVTMTETATQAPANTEASSKARATLSVLPAGEDLLKASERKEVDAVDVDISHIQLKRETASFGPADEEENTNEQAAPNANQTIAPDFDLAPVGTQISENVKEVALSELDLSAISIAEVGADVLIEKPKAATPPQLDLSQLSVADDLDQGLYAERPKESVPAAPDVSHISFNKGEQ